MFPLHTQTVLALTDGDVTKMNIAPDWEVFPFLKLVSQMVGGLWAMALVLTVGAWILAALVWMLSRVIHSGMMQQYSGTVFVWCAIGTILLGASMAIVKFLVTRDVFDGGGAATA